MPQNKVGRFGTFAGVFTPSVLTILGVIMFMRTGHVVGHVGIWQALLILIIAKTITTLTTLSVSAIATNTEIGAGGNYFMISRVLGADIGGTVGITLFISQAVAISFYVIGFTDALVLVINASSPAAAAWMLEYRMNQLISCVMILALFGLTFKGADLAIKTQYFILAALLASVASFLIGGFINFDGSIFDGNTSPIDTTEAAKAAAAAAAAAVTSGAEAAAATAPPTIEAITSIGFWAAFAIFFPAATGIDAGANMSGDLKDPAKSIPSGTLLAILFTGLVYVLLLILMAGYAPAADMVGESSFPALQDMSIFGPLVIAGVFAATLSSALSSFLGAPRILQAMGKDRILAPIEYFGVGHGPDDEPRRATVLSLVIALSIVFAGSLDAIAEIISMFFLIAYGMINLSAFVEGRAGNPSFRPRFKMFGWPAAMVGAIGCAVAMIKINETYAIVAMILAGLIYVSLRGRTKADIGDATRGYTFARMRDNIYDLQHRAVDAKNWRPQLVALTQNADRDIRMLRAASWIESKRGLLSVLETIDADIALADVDHGAGADPGVLIERTQRFVTMRREELNELMQKSSIKALAHPLIYPDASHLPTVIDAHEYGPLAANTYVATMPPPNQPQRRQWLYTLVQKLAAKEKNIVLYKGAKVLPESRDIDIWWHGHQNGSLMAVFAHLMRTNRDWSRGRTRLCRVVETSQDKLYAERELADLMDAARMETETEVFLSSEPVNQVIARESANAGMVFIGLSPQALHHLSQFVESKHDMFAALPPTFLIYSNGEVDLLA